MHFDPGCLPFRAFFRLVSLVTPHRGYFSFPFSSTIFYSRRNYSNILRYRRASNVVQTFRYKKLRTIEIEIPSSKNRIVYRKRVDRRRDHRKIPRSLRRKITLKQTNVIFPRKLFPLMFSGNAHEITAVFEKSWISSRFSVLFRVYAYRDI